MVSNSRLCPGCGCSSSTEDIFCAECGTRLAAVACTSCGSPLGPTSKFCAACGKQAQPKETNAPSGQNESLISAIRLLLAKSQPECILQASTKCLQNGLQPAYAALASVLSMWCFAHLGRFDDARASVLRAREFYASHLGLGTDLRKKYIESPHFVDELRPIGDAEARQNPWSYFILGYLGGPLLAVDDMGEIGPARRAKLMEAWRDFFSDPIPLRGALAYILFENAQFAEAISYLESICLIARRYESTSPIRIELAWPHAILGECYWASNQREKASREWKTVRSLELCASLEPQTDEWGKLALPWFERAKCKLSENGIPLPDNEATMIASEHLREAMKSLIDADKLEIADVDLDELTRVIRRAGRRYTDAVNTAATHLESAERLDTFVWTTYLYEDSPSWCRFEYAKGLLFQKKALIHLTNDKGALAAANYKMANDIWPTRSSFAIMAGLQAACGLVSDATATYRACIDRFEELGAVELAIDRDEFVRQVDLALSELG